MRNHPEPHLPFYLTHFMRALEDLSGDRINSGYGINGIPFQAKKAYCEAWNLDLDQFIDNMNVIDKIYVEKTNEKISRMMKQNG